MINFLPKIFFGMRPLWIVFFCLQLVTGTVALCADNFEVSITDPIVLKTLEGMGLGLSGQLGSRAKSNEELLNQSSQYREVVESVASELLEQEKLIDERFGSLKDKVEVFKLSWLKSSKTKFILAAVTHRFDRRYVPDTECGELRLMYRLAYHTDDLGVDVWNRLPITLMLVFVAKDAFSGRDCRDVAKRMKISPGTTTKKYARQYFSVKGPGKRLTAGKINFRRIELNMQINRWPTIADESFSEQSHYAFKVLQRDVRSGRLVESTLENTPDVARLANNPIELAAFKNWLSEPERLKSIDSGTVLIPKEFLAKSAISVSPYGMARSANHPYSALFEPNDTLTKERLHRLDLLSCAGCHQSQSVAGFHALGFENNPEGNDFTMLKPFSTHFQGIQSWRISDLDHYLTNQSDPVFPQSDRSNRGGMSDACSLQPLANRDAGCMEGFNCEVLHNGMNESDTGQCVPDRKEMIGRVCDSSILISNFDALQDRFFGRPFDSCGENGICAFARAGFPGGICSQHCAESTRSTLCTPVPTLGPFSDCIAAKGNFRECAKANNVKVAMMRCESNADCRLDYACVRAADRQGFCAPPYFMPDLTLSAHSKLEH